MRIFLLLLSFVLIRNVSAFDQVVIWGHKLHSHTHSYVHNAFFRAFQELNYAVYWFDDNDDVQNFNFANTLFLTEGQVDRNIPLRSDCEYILHNCYDEKYKVYCKNHQVIYLQVYTDDVLNHESCQKVASCIYYDFINKCIYMPWATDLLPREIDKVKKNLSRIKKKNEIYWVGTYGEGIFGNRPQIDPFIEAAKTENIDFCIITGISVEKNQNLIASSYMAPTIVGGWQEEKGYIPCRIFKNISYGQMGITNSYRVYELFEKKIVYNSDTYQLFFDAQEKIASMKRKELLELMDFVKKKHTYINRIEVLLDFLSKTKAS